VIDILHGDSASRPAHGCRSGSANGGGVGARGPAHGVGDEVVRGTLDHRRHVFIGEVRAVQVDVGVGDDLVDRPQSVVALPPTATFWPGTKPAVTNGLRTSATLAAIRRSSRIRSLMTCAFHFHLASLPSRTLSPARRAWCRPGLLRRCRAGGGHDRLEGALMHVGIENDVDARMGFGSLMSRAISSSEIVTSRSTCSWLRSTSM